MAAFLLLLLVLCPLAHSQNGKVPVAFSCQCNDPAGAIFSSAFLDALAISPRYRNSDRSSNLYVNVMSIDPDEMGQRTVLSITVGARSSVYELKHLKICGARVIDSCARSVLAEIDSESPR